MQGSEKYQKIVGKFVGKGVFGGGGRLGSYLKQFLKEHFVRYWTGRALARSSDGVF